MDNRADRGTEDATVPLRLVAWNMNHWQQPMLPTNTRHGGWEHLSNELRADVVLAQEAVPPNGSEQWRAAYGEMAGHRDWGSAVVAHDPHVLEPIRSVRARYSRRRYILDKSHPGSVAVARLTVADLQPITLVSVYGVWDGSPVGSMLRAMADLLPLFDSPDGARVILGGDFNVSRSTDNPRHLEQAEAVLSVIRSFGLVEAKSLVADPPAGHADCACLGGPDCGHIATWRSAELDHLFVSSSLAAQVKALSTDATAVSNGLSDHVPLVLDLELSRERTPCTWDEDAFAEEIGRRHGPRAREVVEQLVNWADQKERELTTLTGVHSKTLTRFPTNGCTTEPELVWRLDVELEPKTGMNLFSIHADGQVVMHFGGMRAAPFESPTVRGELRKILNKLPGVEIARNEVYRWPRFPIAALDDPADLSQFVGVLDRLAGETSPGLELIRV